jgi:rhamnogalacturonan endolyase
MSQIYNFNSRNLLGVAYLDGHRPYLIMVRGTYGEIHVDALNFTRSSLSTVWSWDSFQEWGILGMNRYFGQGAHYLHAADLDADGCDELVLGGYVLDQTGIPLWSTGHKHADHCYIGDIDPEHPGLEIYYGIEGILDFFPEYGWGIEMVDALTGDLLWQLGETTTHIHDQGLVADIDARFPGMECFSAEKGPKRWLHTANGTLIASEDTFNVDDSPKAVFWDADPQRELFVDGRIFKFESNTTLGASIPGRDFGWVDILGDWREEIVTIVENELRIYSTTIPAINRHICLMRDPIYRVDVAHFSVGYPQVPMLYSSLE